MHKTGEITWQYTIGHEKNNTFLKKKFLSEGQIMFTVLKHRIRGEHFMKSINYRHCIYNVYTISYA